jgi:hypothetical protein
MQPTSSGLKEVKAMRHIFDMRDSVWTWSDLVNALCDAYPAPDSPDVAELVRLLFDAKPSAVAAAFPGSSPRCKELYVQIARNAIVDVDAEVAAFAKGPPAS